jgi:hypothetical protein
MNGIEFTLRQRPLSQSELYWNVIKPAAHEAAIEMPEARNDHAHHRDADVGTRLIKHKEIEALLPDDVHAGAYLLMQVETPELRVRTEPDRRLVTGRQIGIVFQAQRRGAVQARFLAGPTPHQTESKELVQFGQCAQQRDAGVKMGARAKLDVFRPVLHPMRDGNKGRNPKIAGDIEHPQPASRFSKLRPQIADVRIIKLAEIYFPALQAIVSPDCIRVPFHEFEEPLHDCFPDRIAGSTAVGIRMGTRPVEKVQKPSRKVPEALVSE